MSFLSTTALPFLPAAPPALVPGQTVLAVGVVDPAQMSPNYNYAQPYEITSVRSAATMFGPGRFLQAIGELFRQKTPSVLAAAVSAESDLYNGVLDYLIDQPFSIVLPVGLTVTDPRLSAFAAFAYSREQRGKPIHVVMPVDPTGGVASLVNDAWGVQAGFLPGDPATVQLGRYFVFTLDQLLINPNVPAQYQADAAPSIAGLIAATPPQTAITYASLQGVDLVGGYNSADCASLASAGYTVLTRSTRRGIVPYLGVTGTSDQPNSSAYSPCYHRLSTLRTVQYVVTVLQDRTQGLPGEPSNGQVQKLVNGILQSLQDDGVILAFDANVQIAQLAGTITIDLSILPPYETTSIAVTTQVRGVQS